MENQVPEVSLAWGDRTNPIWLGNLYLDGGMVVSYTDNGLVAALDFHDIEAHMAWHAAYDHGIGRLRSDDLMPIYVWRGGLGIDDDADYWFYQVFMSVKTLPIWRLLLKRAFPGIDIPNTAGPRVPRTMLDCLPVLSYYQGLPPPELLYFRADYVVISPGGRYFSTYGGSMWQLPPRPTEVSWYHL